MTPQKGLYIYLHGLEPVIIHRDLTARNILLTTSMHAKIADLGNARMVTVQQLTKTMSKAPGTVVYMPPEALADRPHYDATLDIFSFGHLSLFAVIQKFPGDLLSPTYHNEKEELLARSEVQRREAYITKLHQVVGKAHTLATMVGRCLANMPQRRPTAVEVMEVLKELSTELGGTRPEEFQPATSSIEAQRLNAPGVLEMLETAGTLTKKLSWKKSIFEVTATHLKHNSKKHKDVLLSDVEAVFAEPCKDPGRFVFVLCTKGRKGWKLSAYSEEQRLKWMEAIKPGSSGLPLRSNSASSCSENTYIEASELNLPSDRMIQPPTSESPDSQKYMVVLPLTEAAVAETGTPKSKPVPKLGEELRGKDSLQKKQFAPDQQGALRPSVCQPKHSLSDEPISGPHPAKLTIQDLADLPEALYGEAHMPKEMYGEVVDPLDDLYSEVDEPQQPDIQQLYIDPDEIDEELERRQETHNLCDVSEDQDDDSCKQNRPCYVNQFEGSIYYNISDEEWQTALMEAKNERSKNSPPVPPKHPLSPSHRSSIAVSHDCGRFAVAQNRSATPPPGSRKQWQSMRVGEQSKAQWKSSFSSSQDAPAQRSRTPPPGSQKQWQSVRVGERSEAEWKCRLSSTAEGPVQQSNAPPPRREAGDVHNRGTSTPRESETRHCTLGEPEVSGTLGGDELLVLYEDEVQQSRPDWAIAKSVSTPQKSNTLKRLRQHALFIRMAALGKFKKIGQGQFGTVYKSTLNKGRGKPCDVAIKTIKKYTSQQERNEFLREMSIMMKMMHPNIVMLYGLVPHREHESPFMVMEYLPNGDLKQFLTNNKRSVDALMKYMIDVAMGMHYLSEKGLIHRDLAARNIMVAENESCKVADFGLLRELPKDKLIYLASTKVPFPIRWMAPESIEHKKFSTASDVWSFGVVQWEMYNPRSIPYDDMNDIEYTLHTVKPDSNRLTIPRDYPAIVAKIMKACWNYNPENRPSFLLISSLLSNL